MREIKFRAWSEKYKRMRKVVRVDFCVATGVFVSVMVRTDEGLNIILAEDLILMQYTGLKDKDGQEIYEGDVITFVPRDGSTKIPQRAVVEYCEKRACFLAHSEAWLIPLTKCRSITVIGNIHENPELQEK